MTKLSLSAAFMLFMFSSSVFANDYTIILKNGTNPQCDISTESGSRIVIGRQIVELSQFTEQDGTYTYQWSYGKLETVAIQVRLKNSYVPDVWQHSGCTYAPRFDGNHTSFTQQYLEPDPKIPYTCNCTSTWDE